ncbi:TIM barrel protein [Fodinicola feengrottensis]|uniref:TIM barrel protein n=1 Tax=Fodinicola feengrottensis TaxID=435914 RepID=UPI0013D0BD0F|nr:TIM barrel protein [Fodinicola feengrottensis]
MTGSRIAAAPISWGVSEVPGWGYQLPPRRVLAEMRELGLAATEAGPDGFLPAAGPALREALEAESLTLVGGFTPLVLHDASRDWRTPLAECIERFKSAGGDSVVLAAATGLDGYDVRPELTTAEWDQLLATADAAVAVCAEAGLAAVLHPHVGTVVEQPAEIQRVLDGCGIPLCLDTGHVACGGGDPVALATRHPERVGHVHMKDVDEEKAALVAGGKLAFSDAVTDGVFRPLGAGDIDIAAVVRALSGAGYQGWYVLEQDIKLAGAPTGDGPKADVAASAAYLRSLL